MVFYFESRHQGLPIFQLYMGSDKEENELLIRNGWDCDVWFHVDNLSSAHVYVRLPEGYEWTTIPALVLEDCAQLVKANSIAGNKRDRVTVIYCPWSNLHKSNNMSTGQVGFKQADITRKHQVSTRRSDIINRLDKTKQVRKQDQAELEQAKIDYEEQVRRRNQDEYRIRHKQELEKQRYYKSLAEEQNRGYDELYNDEMLAQSSNQNRGEDWEDDFM